MSRASDQEDGEPRRVTALLGCGVIGASWVAAFAAAGHHVRIWDPDHARAQLLVEQHAGQVFAADSAAAAVDGAAFVQENGPEDIDLKRRLWQGIAHTLGERTVVASSTSTLRPSDLQQGVAFADRLLIGHPFNPPHIIPLVEVVAGAGTADWATELAMAFYAGIGKHPIRLRTERPGHLANRLQAALWREAVDAVASGQASVADVDAAVTLALGPRWALTGPFATFALGGGPGGLAHFMAHLGAPLEALWDDAQRPQMTPALRQQLVDETAGATRPLDVATRNRMLLEILAMRADAENRR